MTEKSLTKMSVPQGQSCFTYCNWIMIFSKYNSLKTTAVQYIFVEKPFSPSNSQITHRGFVALLLTMIRNKATQLFNNSEHLYNVPLSYVETHNRIFQKPYG